MSQPVSQDDFNRVYDLLREKGLSVARLVNGQYTAISSAEMFSLLFPSLPKYYCGRCKKQFGHSLHEVRLLTGPSAEVWTEQVCDDCYSELHHFMDD